jgi:(p)ppGpp synthase/HD superfamily hydrolase
MNKQEQLAKGILTATLAHDGQFDKGDKPYILHPLHLMHQLMFDAQLATIAVLHDVIEDSLITTQDLRNDGFSARVINAVDLLTHKKEHSYTEYIYRIAGNYDAIRVKRKDLEHNSDITRLKGVTEKDLERIEKYHKAFTSLGVAKRDFERK